MARRPTYPQLIAEQIAYSMREHSGRSDIEIGYRNVLRSFAADMADRLEKHAPDFDRSAWLEQAEPYPADARRYFDGLMGWKEVVDHMREY